MVEILKFSRETAFTPENVRNFLRRRWMKLGRAFDGLAVD